MAKDTRSQVNIRLTPEDAALIARLQRWTGIKSTSDLIRHALTYYEQHGPMRPKERTMEYTLTDPVTGKVFTGTIGRTLAEVENDVDMVEFHADELDYPVSIIRYHTTGLVFVPSDWESTQPEDADDIPLTRWLDWKGRPAIIMEGWPVMFE